MTDCLNVEMRDRLPDLANESLDPAARVLVLAHIEECTFCAAEVAILRSVRMVVLETTPRVDVASIVGALPRPRAVAREDAGIIPIQSARSARRRSWGSWQIAAAVTVLAGGIGSYAVLRPDSPVRGIDSTGIVAAAESSTGLALTGALSYMSDAELDALVKDIDAIEALPSTEIETGRSAVAVPLILPDSVVQELEVY
jgi:anti-sigma factor RsiW